MSRRALMMPLVIALAGCGAETPPQQQDTGPVTAAVSGVAKVVRDEAAGRPIPRDKLPAFVETMEGGRYATSSTGSNGLRSTGMLLYMVDASVPDALAFHRASMERHGFAPGDTVARSVRKATEHSVQGKATDGREMTVVVIDQGPATLPIQMLYTIPKV